jgi:hypothetical protein
MPTVPFSAACMSMEVWVIEEKQKHLQITVSNEEAKEVDKLKRSANQHTVLCGS